MINKILTVIAFLGFMLEQVFNSSIPLRLLGVKSKKWYSKYISFKIDFKDKSHLYNTQT